MSDCIANQIHEWSQALGQLALYYAGLGPAERQALANRLAAYPQYECVDPLAEALRQAQKDLLLAIADELTCDTAAAPSAASPSKALGQSLAARLARRANGRAGPRALNSAASVRKA
jgi:hypothetical protein